MGTQLRKLFAYLDAEGVGGKTASAELVLGSGDIVTIRAGGPGVHSGPSSSPFEDYEVLLDHEPCRFWARFTDQVGMVYAHVPALLVAHHVLRHGGVAQMVCSTTLRRAPLFVDLALDGPQEYVENLDLLVPGSKAAHRTNPHPVSPVACPPRV